MFDLSGKGALVTGASGGIGAAIARTLHANGAAVALSGTRAERLEALAGELGERCHVVPADLSDGAAVAALPAAAESALGSLDILINNAGLTRDNLAMRMKDDEWQTVLDVNLTAAFRLRPRGSARHDEEPVGADHQRDLGGRGHRQSRSGKLCGVEGGAHGHDQGVGSGSRQPRRHRQLRRAGLHRNGDDGRTVRGAKRSHYGAHSHCPAGLGRRCRRLRSVPRQRGGGLCDRSDPPRQWRHGDDLSCSKLSIVDFMRLDGTCEAG